MAEDFFYALLAVFVLALIAVAIACSTSSDTPVYTQRNDAERAVTTLCANHGGAVYYDVQDQNVLVYACNDTHKLQLYPY